MIIFIDLDGTLYDTDAALNGSTVYHILMAELRAPLFDNAKEVIKEFKEQDHIVMALTKRGLIDDEEVKITKQRFQIDGFIDYDEQRFDIYGMISHEISKYSSIEDFYNNHPEFDKEEAILIDDNVKDVVEAASHGVHSVLFAPDLEEIDKESKKLLNKYNVSIIKSWLEFKEIVKEKASKLANKTSNSGSEQE